MRQWYNDGEETSWHLRPVLYITSTNLWVFHKASLLLPVYFLLRSNFLPIILHRLSRQAPMFLFLRRTRCQPVVCLLWVEIKAEHRACPATRLAADCQHVLWCRRKTQMFFHIFPWPGLDKTVSRELARTLNEVCLIRRLLQRIPSVRQVLRKRWTCAMILHQGSIA